MCERDRETEIGREREREKRKRERDNDGNELSIFPKFSRTLFRELISETTFWETIFGKQFSVPNLETNKKQFSTSVLKTAMGKLRCLVGLGQIRSG